MHLRSNLHSFFRQEQLTSVYWETYLSEFCFACTVGRVNRAGIFSWHCSCEGSSHLALLWWRPGSNKLHTEFLKIRGLLLQIKVYSSLHLDTHSTDLPAERSSSGLTQHPQECEEGKTHNPDLHEDGKRPHKLTKAREQVGSKDQQMFKRGGGGNSKLWPKSTYALVL